LHLLTEVDVKLHQPFGDPQLTMLRIDNNIMKFRFLSNIPETDKADDCIS
jgi:hypothetical protein